LGLLSSKNKGLFKFLSLWLDIMELLAILSIWLIIITIDIAIKNRHKMSWETPHLVAKETDTTRRKIVHWLIFTTLFAIVGCFYFGYLNIPVIEKYVIDTSAHILVHPAKIITKKWSECVYNWTGSRILGDILSGLIGPMFPFIAFMETTLLEFSIRNLDISEYIFNFYFGGGIVYLPAIIKMLMIITIGINLTILAPAYYIADWIKHKIRPFFFHSIIYMLIESLLSISIGICYAIIYCCMLTNVVIFAVWFITRSSQIPVRPDLNRVIYSYRALLFGDHQSIAISFMPFLVLIILMVPSLKWGRYVSRYFSDDFANRRLQHKAGTVPSIVPDDVRETIQYMDTYWKIQKWFCILIPCFIMISSLILYYYPHYGTLMDFFVNGTFLSIPRVLLTQ